MPDNIPHVLLIAASLNLNSRSAVLAAYAHERLKESGISAELIDLRTHGDLPFAGSPASYGATEAVVTLKAAMRRATHLIFAVPVYNFGPNAAAKNVVELAGGDELNGKTVGFLCAAGGQRGYMGILSLANSLMMDFRCWIVPRFVHATGADVKEGEIINADIRERIGQLLDEMVQR